MRARLIPDSPASSDRPHRRSALAGDSHPASRRRIGEPNQFAAVEPNAVLRGGPLDGDQVHLATRVAIGIELDGERFVYPPTAELDDEYPALAIWALDRVVRRRVCRYGTRTRRHRAV